MGVYDAVLSWLSAHPQGKPSRVAVMTNAGYESVASADLLEGDIQGHHLEAAEKEALKALLLEHKLQDLVAAHLPLDLTPMADEAAYLASARLVANTAADTVVVGIVPLTMRLETRDMGKMLDFAHALAAIAQESGKRIGVAVEGGPIFEPYRQALQRAGLPVFLSMERALLGLKLLAEN
jgi:acyl-CoA synthetase (NDP forming)